MSNQLMVAIVREPDWTDFTEKVLGLSDTALLDYAVNINPVVDDLQEEAQLALDMREWLLAQFDQMHDGRGLIETSTMHIQTIDGKSYIVTGGTSFGDDPSPEYDAVIAIDYLELNR